ncbi:MAG: ArsR family transcriptional regulator [Actinomycetota bacterium]|nr:MAG: ArsR family transcriptional regulator [Actinomycetota bacterium]
MATHLSVEMPLVPPTTQGRAVLARFFQAISDPNRLALLEFLVEGERSATECVQLLELAQSRVSSHLACLINCGFITSRRQGRFVFYRVEDQRVIELVKLGVEIAADHAEAVATCTRM